MPVHECAKEIVPKVKYEWQIFSWLVQRIEAEYEAAPQSTKNLLMESLLLHARVLYDFFVRAPKGDDVSACHFFDDASDWCVVSSDLCPYLRANMKRLNKKLAHLTYSRLTEDEQWAFGAIRDEVSHGWRTFLDALQYDQRKWFD